MERERVVAAIRDLSPWFHRIEVPRFGLVTKTASVCGEDPDHPLPTWRHVRDALPADLTNKTVLDIGCNAGFYSFEARKRGAAAVLGVEARRHHVRQARLIQAALGLDRIAFRRMSLYELDPLRHGQFDVVLALGLVYHLKHLLLGLEGLYRLTRETLIVESAVAAEPVPVDSSPARGWLRRLRRDRRSRPPTERERDDRPHLPLHYIRNRPTTIEHARNWFIPSTSTLVGMLSDIGFENVECTSEFKGRAVIRAAKPAAPTDSTRPQWLRAGYRVSGLRASYAAGEPMELEVRIENREIGTWLCRGIDQHATGQVSLSASLSSDGDPTLLRELPRVPLPRDIPPGQHCDLTLRLRAPDTPGTFILELDLISESVCLFQDLGAPPCSVTIRVH